LFFPFAACFAGGQAMIQGHGVTFLFAFILQEDLMLVTVVLALQTGKAVVQISAP
jgi:hypothetical protein